MLGYKSRAFFLTMKAVYVDWHLPRKMKGVEIPVKKHWEVVMIIRTTYFSREINGFSPVLYCDQATYDYYESLDLIKHFDEVFPILPNDSSEIDFDPTVFWAAAKFLAIEKCDSPFIMIDLDAEIRFKINPEKHDAFFPRRILRAVHALPGGYGQGADAARCTALGQGVVAGVVAGDDGRLDLRPGPGGTQPGVVGDQALCA